MYEVERRWGIRNAAGILNGCLLALVFWGALAALAFGILKVLA